ncbi:MAG: RNA polymerase sigma factor [Myxococcota bacterium]
MSADFQAALSRNDFQSAGSWLVQTYAGEVLGLCGAMVRDRAEAEDLAQDVFGKAFAGLDRFRGEASPRTWLLKIARNRCVDHLRAQNRAPWGPSSPFEAEPDEHPDETALPSDLISRRSEVQDALSQLAEAERALVVLRYRHGFEYPELAETFGLKEGTVRMRLSRALRRMRRALEKTEVDLAAVSEGLRPESHVPPPPSAGRAPQSSLSRARRVGAAMPTPAAAAPAAPPGPPGYSGSKKHPLAAYFANVPHPVAKPFVERMLAEAAKL